MRISGRPLEPIPAAAWELAATIALGAFMSQLDTSAVNVALRRIGADLGAPLGIVQWTSTGYLLALAVSLPASSWLARRLGSGRIWLGSVAAFTFASALCAAAPTVGWLIALRAAQGLSAGQLIPAGQTLIGRAVGPQRLGRVMATVGIAVSLAPALGPTVGGLLVTAGSWRAIFLLNLPIGAAALVLGLRQVSRRAPAVAVERPDLPELGLLSVGIPAVVLGVTVWGERRSLGLGSGALLGAGLLMLIAFAARNRRATRPVTDLGLFRRPVYAAAATATTLAGASLFGAAILLPLYFQIGRGQDIVASGLSLVSLGFGTALMLPLAGSLTDRMGGGAVSCGGCALTCATTIPFALIPLTTPALLVQLLLFARGWAIALAVVPPVVAAYASVEIDQLPDATMQVNVLQRVGGSLGGALFAVILASRLGGGVEAAFHTVFWWVCAAALLGLVASAWLVLCEGRDRPAAPRREHNAPT